MGPVSLYQLPTVVVVVVARTVTVAVVVSAVVVVVVIVIIIVIIASVGVGVARGNRTIVTVALASFQDYCSRCCLRALFIFGLPVYVGL